MPRHTDLDAERRYHQATLALLRAVREQLASRSQIGTPRPGVCILCARVPMGHGPTETREQCLHQAIDRHLAVQSARLVGAAADTPFTAPEPEPLAEGGDAP